jgi:hypothetical protein
MATEGGSRPGASAAEESPEELGELVLDATPVFTLWKVSGKCNVGLPRTVWIYQAEGGEVTQGAADAYFSSLEFKVAVTEGEFTTFYDLTNSLRNFLPFALQLAKNARRIRELMRPVRTVILCTHAGMRNIMRFIIRMVGGDSPYVIVDSVDAGWAAAFRARSTSSEAGLSDAYEGTSLTAGLDPELTARYAATMAGGLVAG